MIPVFPSADGPLTDPTTLPPGYGAAAPALRRPALDGPEQADVAVIGAGFTGLSAALHLAQAGCTVAVLEGREVGWGGSGRAFGQVVPYFKHGEAHVLAAFGPDWGERMIAGAAAGPALVSRLIADHGIACERGGSGLLFAAHAPRAEAGLERRAAFWQARGAEVAMLRDDALAAETGTRFYRAALLDRRGFCLDPLAYARGLARAAIAAGARVYEASPATSLRRTGAGWEIGTPAGRLRADQIVIATDAYTGNAKGGALWPGLDRTVVPLRAYQLVSQPLSDNLRRGVLPGGQALTDTRRLYSGIRLRPDGRLHVSVDGPAFRNGGAPDAAAATRRVQALFPDLPPPAWDSAVAGWVGMSADQYPHIHRLAPGLLAAVGLSGRGIVLGTLLGREAGLRVLRRPEADWTLPDTPLRPIPFRPFVRPALRGLLSAYRILDARELEGRR